MRGSMEIKLEQGSADWLEWRRTKIMASEAPIILGVSPYQTPLDLYNTKVLGKTQTMNSAMQMGHDREHEARVWAEEQLGERSLFPTVLESEQEPWMGASLDGISQDKTKAVEIKWNNKENHQMTYTKMHKGILQSRIFECHYAQIQHQYFVSSVKAIYYVTCWKDEKFIFQVYRNDKYITEMIKKERHFYEEHVLKKVPPLPTDRDYVEVEDEKSLKDMWDLYLTAKQELKNYEAMESYWKGAIIEKMGERNSSCKFGKLTKYEVKGRVDYETLLDQVFPDWKNEIATYRKPSTWAYKLTAEEQNDS